jgi:Cu-Zn family superoxide dismutase
MSTRLRVTSGLVALLAASLVGCTPRQTRQDGFPLASASGPWTIYEDPWAGTPMAGTPNPITVIMGTASAWEVDDGQMTMSLSVAGLPPNRAFGSHLHKLSCGDPMKAGGHYENKPWPTSTTSSDPAYANPDNEAWLDFTTDVDGKAIVSTLVKWIPRVGEANAVIIHAMPTTLLPKGGLAGAKLACLDIPF